MNKNALKYLILVSAFFAIAADFFEYKPLFYFLKPLTTSLIILLVFRFRSASRSNYSNSIGIGLFFCLIGDVFLLFPNFFVFGLGSFLIGHLLFIRAFVKEVGWQLPYTVGIPLILVGCLLFGFTHSNLERLLIPVVFYMAIIVLMSWQGIALSIKSTQIAFKRIGIAVSFFFFFFSLIALDKFYIPFAFSGIVVLSTYWIAIFLLANSTGATD